MQRRSGQSLTEYIILVGLVAALLIGAVTALSSKLRETFSRSTAVLDAKAGRPITTMGSESSSSPKPSTLKKQPPPLPAESSTEEGRNRNVQLDRDRHHRRTRSSRGARTLSSSPSLP